MRKKILIGILLLLAAIQFFQPNKNIATGIAKDDIRNKYLVTGEVITILEKACYDCHSNNTNYPWYAYIQPVAWYTAHHINEGKAELNFSDFANYPEKKAHHKLEEVEETVANGEMPNNAYLQLHTNAKLTDTEKQILVGWSRSLREEILK